MRHPNAIYFYGVLAKAIHLLVTAPADIKQRLSWALDIVIAIPRDVFPDDLRDDWDRIIATSTKYESKYSETRLKATMRRIRKNTASKIADDLYSLYLRFDDYLR